ncbi:nicotinate phosphoribosyltransferase [Trueperella bonasi]|uniref:Nicotinate phosphoribosyltransferase n=1 Tax=Trueperella bonasi TaxID=312286 RepID=A0ABT9NE99_9ACTO|nr:nicotinate phosphoribosyltransferase [Trueperella bonasi]MDP9805718.1 nicotinate phosphoribosyltransferase [Trueperella bonasi]
MTKFTSTALLTDMYELTMVDSAMKSGTAGRASVFEVFGRRLPGRRRYGVVAGTGRVLEALKDFRFTESEIDFVRSSNIVSEDTLDWLASYRFTGDIYGYAEGEVYFPGSPLLTVTGTFADAVVLETLILSIMNYDSAVATAASRMTIASHDRPCLEMGARRMNEYAAVAAARASIIGGFLGTSNLEAARSYGIKPIGTAAHSFTLLHDTEADAFRAQIKTMGTDTTLLVDTYDVEKGVELAVQVAREAGGELGAVRLDSGDLVAQAFKVRKQLDDMGATTTKITVTSDLDEYAIAALNAAPVDSYGVGTRLVTGSGRPTAQLVYKLVAREREDGTMQGVAKMSDFKGSVGGLKIAGRKHDETGRATEELIVSAGSWEDGLACLDEHKARPLQVKLVDGGEVSEEYTREGELARAAERHRNSRAALPYAAWRLSEGDPALPTTMIDLQES